MLKVRDIMTTDVATVTPDSTLRDLMELLSARHISGAPVVEGDQLVGIVSASDIIAFAANEVEEPGREEPPEVSIDPSTEDLDAELGAYYTDLWEEEGAELVERFASPPGAPTDRFATHTVDELMTREVASVAPDLDVWRAAEAMRRANIHRLLVVAGGRLLGVVTTTDIVRAVAERRLATRRYVFTAGARFDDRGW